MMSDSDDDDDVPQLSAHALAALKEFYTQQQAGDQDDAMPMENWQLSQFWYDDKTALKLAEEVIQVAGENGRIACISSPTAYHKVISIKPSTCTAVVLEYDKRFEKYGNDFVFYDFKNPLDLPPELEKSFDIILADPPFLSEECLTKTAMTIRYLTKGKILLCTGAVMGDLAARLLDVKVCDFVPKHSNNLANEFRCYANYKPLTLDKGS